MVGLTRQKHEQGGHNGLDPFGYRTVRDDHGQINRPHRLEVVEARPRSCGTSSTATGAATFRTAGSRRR
jgi:hypothetical protein